MRSFECSAVYVVTFLMVLIAADLIMPSATLTVGIAAMTPLAVASVLARAYLKCQRNGM